MTGPPRQHLVPCRSCGYPVGTGAQLCPNCGQSGPAPLGRGTNTVVLVAVLLVVLLVLVAVLTGCASTSSSSNASGATVQADASAQLACSHFRNVVADEANGVLTDAELRNKLKEVYGDARYSSNAGIAGGARAMLAAVTQGDPAGLRRGLDAFGGACTRIGQ